MLPLDPDVFTRAYDRVANGVLWPAHHLLPHRPLEDADWAGYTAYAQAFADALAEQAAPRAQVLVQDYHLALVPRLLRARRPDLRVSHFSHTPWAPPAELGRLPAARALLEGMLGADAVGFLSPRWADAFLACCRDLLGAPTTDDTVRWAGRTVRVGVHPLGVDAPRLRARAAEPDVRARAAELRALRRRLLGGAAGRPQRADQGDRAGPAGLRRPAAPPPRAPRPGGAPGARLPLPRVAAGVPGLRRAGPPGRRRGAGGVRRRRPGRRCTWWSRTTTPARWRPSGWPTSCWSTPCATA